MLNDPSNNDPEFYASPTYNIHLITTFSPLLITLNLQKLIRPVQNEQILGDTVKFAARLPCNHITKKSHSHN
jgi:hypothetical protein